MKTETLFSRRSDEWETPQEFFQELDKEFHFDLDACASDENHKCDMYYTAADNGLSKNWGGHAVWCNPPYSNVKAWVRKAYYEGHKPNTVVVVLVFSRTDTKWWWNYVQHKAEVRFVKGRIKFGGSENNAPFPSALIIYRGPEEKTDVDPRQLTWDQLKEI
jgi:site-specific DNA-methyltransferase (adenine-specific)